MKKLFVAFSIAVLAAMPLAAAGQGFGVAARAGTLGIGAEAALGLSNRLVVRAGLGLVPIEVSSTISDIDVTLKFPKTWMNVGIDLYVAGPMRIGAGMLYKPDDLTLTGDFTGPVDIGTGTYTPAEIGTLTGSMDSGKTAPYVLIGFGKHTSSGIGLSLDLGAAFLKDPVIQLDASGGTLSNSAPFRANLDQQEQDFQNDIPGFLNIYPILNLGLRFGIC